MALHTYGNWAKICNSFTQREETIKAEAKHSKIKIKIKIKIKLKYFISLTTNVPNI